MRNALNVSVVTLAAILTIDPAAFAAEIKVMSTHAVQEVLEEICPQFERATGYKVLYSFDPTTALKNQILQGAAFDLVFLSRAALDELTQKGKVIADTRMDIGRSGLGVAVRKGALKPDISTAENFKQAILAAKSIVRSTQGMSGAHFEKLIAHFGIADQMKGKIKLGPSGRISELVADGQVEMAVQQISEILPVKGVEFVGPFPPEIQLYSTFSIGISTDTKQLDAAKVLIAYFKTPAAVPVIKSKGLDPVQ